MFIEEILSKYLKFGQNSLTFYNYNLLISFNDQNLKNIGLTEKQKSLLERILKKHIKEINLLLGQDVEIFLNLPNYRLKTRYIDREQTIVIVDHKFYGRAMKLKFPFNQEIIEYIQKNKTKALLAQWSPENTAWILPLVEKNLLFIQDLHKTFSFTLDKEIENYLNHIDNTLLQLETIVPMVVKENNEYYLQNLPGFAHLSGKNLTEKLFTARKKGVLHWDDDVASDLDRDALGPNIIDFLKKAPNIPFVRKFEEFTENELETIIKNLTPCLFVIPVQEEYTKLKKSLEILSKIPIQPEEISVMFRLPNSVNEEFNQFIRNNKLNNPITDKTKAIFVSHKITKPVLTPKLYFNSVISYNYHYAHYALANFLKNQPNIITLE